MSPLQHKPLLLGSQEQRRSAQQFEGNLRFVIHVALADARYARLRAFPPQAVLGPCFSTGWRSAFVFHNVTPVYGRPAESRSRRPVNGPDNSQRIPLLEPDVNVGPSTAFGGKGRKRPCKVLVARSTITRWRFHLL
jgi:hypothetical protein